jgi:tape measure domain-containing protein
MNGLDPTAGSLQAILDQVAAAGGNTEQLKGIATALTQILGKGRVSAEEMNQLGERGINGWELLSKAIKRFNGQELDTTQLRKMAEEGNLGRRAVMLMIEQMGIDSAGAAETMSRSWSGMVQGLQTRWKLFKKDIMDVGVFDRLRDVLKRVLATVDRLAASGELKKWAAQVGDMFVRLFAWIEDRAPKAWSWMVTTLPEKLRFVTDKLQFLADLVGGWDNLVLGGLAAYVAGPLAASLAGLLFQLTALNMALLGTPVGLLLTGGALVVGGGAFAIYQARQGRVEFPTTPTGPRRINGIFSAPAMQGDMQGDVAQGIFRGAPIVGGKPGLRPAGFTDDQLVGIVKVLDDERARREAPNGGLTIKFENVPPGTRFKKDRAIPGVNLEVDYARGPTMSESR